MTQPSGADGPGEHGQAQDSQAEDTGPGDAAPDDTAPDDTAPGDTAPGGTRSDDTRSGGTGHEDYGVRAETYLRLLAEDELRRALARPRSPVQRVPPTAVLWAANAVGALTGTAQLAARSAGPAAAWAGQGALRFLAPPARQAGRALPPSVRRANRAVRQAGWQARIAADRLGDRLTDRLTGRSRADDDASGSALERVYEVAHVLVAAGVLSEAVARSVGLGFGYALASRGLANDFSTWDDRPYNFTQPATLAGPIMVAGIGAQTDLEADGYRARTHLLALVLAPGTALLTTVSWLAESPPGPPQEAEDEEFGWPLDDRLHLMVRNMNGQATDNRGGTYQLRMGGGGGSSDGPWEARLELSPEPPAGLEWLDIRLAPDQDPVRVDLTTAVRDEADPATARPKAGPVQRAERIIDAASERLLGGVCPDPEHEHERDLTGVAGVAGALRAAGVLPEDSPALARLRTLIRRMGLTVPAELAGPADADDPADLPEAWLAVLSPRRWSGLDGEASAATAVAVLPELDGARCVIAGLMTSSNRHSVTHSTTMQVLAWGWPWQAGLHELWQPFTWWARDDAGRWYQGTEEGYSSGGDMAEIQIALSPPVHPEATSLELILCGASGQVSATVPVTWGRMP